MPYPKRRVTLHHLDLQVAVQTQPVVRHSERLAQSAHRLVPPIAIADSAHRDVQEVTGEVRHQRQLVRRGIHHVAK